MAELPFQDSTAIRGSPDSVIYTHDYNFSLFSSASASVDRSSFASDARDRDSPSSDFSHVLIDYCYFKHVAALHSANGYLSKKADKAEVHKHENNKVNVDDEAPPLVSARNSFTLALKERQERRLRSEALTKESERPRPASLDLNKAAANVVVMKKNTTPSRKSVNFSSPGTPNYCQESEGVNKGWQSERAALQTGANNRRLSFNNRRNLPSKWEDAERWIFSPVAGDGVGRPTRLQPQKRPKSKSGPLGAPGVAYYAQFSPGISSKCDESSINSLIEAAGVLMPSSVSVPVGGSNGYLQNKGEPCVARSASMNGSSNLICQSSGASSQDEKVDDAKDGGANVFVAVSRRDAATQMSPEGGSHSSSRRRSSFSASTASILPIREVPSFKSTKPDVRVIVTRWSKKHKSRISVKGSEDVDGNWKLKAVEAHSGASKSLSKAQRDEAKITAWENLQKAKAEAAIRKLEMKLEKKRSRTIDKIMNKLKSAENKAQEMRSSVEADEETQVSKTSFKAMPFRRRWQMGSLSACFTCNAF